MCLPECPNEAISVGDEILCYRSVALYRMRWAYENLLARKSVRLPTALLLITIIKKPRRRTLGEVCVDSSCRSAVILNQWNTVSKMQAVFFVAHFPICIEHIYESNLKKYLRYPHLFERYQQLRHNPISMNEVVEKPTMLECYLPELKGKKVLDLGCGMGEHLAYYLEQGASRLLD